MVPLAPGAVAPFVKAEPGEVPMLEHRRVTSSPRRSERGLALIVVVFVLIAVLAGGLAAVALTSGELASSYGYRSRNVVQSCAQAAIEKVRARMGSSSLTIAEIEKDNSTYTLPSGGTLTLKIGHLGGGTGGLAAGDSPLKELPADAYDVSSINSGENVTNAVAASTGGTPHLYSVVATCTGPGNAEQEVQMVFKYVSVTPTP